MIKSRLHHGVLKKHFPRSKLGRERGNLSFFIVIVFFVIFIIIVLTEILLMDDKERTQGYMRKGIRRFGDREYDEGEDYTVYQDKNFDSNLAALLNDGSNKKKDDSLPLPTLNPNLTAKDAVWQTVLGTRFKVLIYSAFYDQRTSRSIRLIGATKTRGYDRVWCRFWYHSQRGNKTVVTSVTSPASIKMIRENWNLRYSACFLNCPLKKNVTVPLTVSVVGQLRLPPNNLFLVNNINASSVPDPSSLAVCVKPLHFDYNKAMSLLEFLELNTMLGVRHFILYNHTIGNEVSCILKRYEERGLVTILPWQLNMKSQKEIRTEGLFAALNDCLYRNMYKYTYLALIDLDEYIIPRHNQTLQDLIRWMNKRVPLRTIGSFSFQNAFFYLQWEDDPLSQGLDPGLLTLRKTRRKNKLHPHKQRSKYICRPELVIEAGNHFVWEFVPGSGTINVPADAAFLHHYRVCEFGGNDCVKTGNVVDRTVFRYKEKLLDRIDMRWRELSEDGCIYRGP